MTILAIETSCDDTCVSIIKVKSQKSKVKSFDIFSNVISSQVKLHAKYGGVYPALAKREHQKNLPIVFKKATKNLDISKIDLIGVTIGPGLEPCLWQGVNFAKELAKKLNLSISPINHIEAHIAVNFIDGNFKFNYRPGLSTKGWSSGKIPNSKNILPAICLVVSGGHTQLILMKEVSKYKIIGETRDDAAGECFDKTARILGLGYPGGPAISAKAKEYPGQPSLSLPRPMIYQKNYDFSFSGLKTAVLYHYKNQPPKVRKSDQYIQAMAKEIQQAVIDVLIYKTIKAAKNYKVQSIILGGGVAANEELRKQFKSNIKNQLPNVKFLMSPKNLCTDNGVMVGVAAYFQWLKGRTKSWQKITADANLKIGEKI